jgi:capsular exopolysaccharide synthesis family protein
VTGPVGQEGKTTIAANLGVALAVAGRSVIVVGADLRRPRLHELFGVPGDVGFSSVVGGEAPLSSALRSVAGEDHLLVLPAGPQGDDPADVMESERAAEVLGALRSRADLVLVDSPSVLAAPEALALASHADGTLVVAKAGVTRRVDWLRAVETLRQAEARLVGAVLTGASGRPSAYQWADGDTHPVLHSPYGVDLPSASAAAP